MSVMKKTIGQKIYPEVTSGIYEIAYRKDGGTWVHIEELNVEVPLDITAKLIISIDCNEKHGGVE